MKKILNIGVCISAIVLLSLSSCSDMLETDSSRQSFDPELNQKTDSVFYAFGIMQAMQQVADQYFFQGELRGDLVATTTITESNLKNIANFSEVQASGNLNKYDSAYVYYRVINNCNYYLAHRDTTLRTGADNVTINEFVAVAAFRAWAYLQLGRLYERVPYFTEPLTSISQINNNSYPEYTLAEIVNNQTDYLNELMAKYGNTFFSVPTFNVSSRTAGTTKWGLTKNVSPARCFIPVDLVMGDMYLETGQYQLAAQSYFKYLLNTRTLTGSLANMVSMRRNHWQEMPSDYDASATIKKMGNPSSWSNIFNDGRTASPTDVITYIPMAVNKIRGTTTAIPEAFGYDYYSTSAGAGGRCPTMDEISLLPSEAYYTLSDSVKVYYLVKETTSDEMNYAKIGDGRASVLEKGDGEDSLLVWTYKPRAANVVLYRATTVYLHLAEALNRCGYPDAAFCILKDGIKEGIEDYVIDPLNPVDGQYLRPETYQFLSTTVPFLSTENLVVFSENTSSNKFQRGIHQHGAGLTGGLKSPYQMNTVVGDKLQELTTLFSQVQPTGTLNDTINAVEDLICDEYALEFAFEGSRFYDLCRLARHKNEAGLYGGNFGSLWLSDKIVRAREASLTEAPAVDLTNPSNWFLPFK